MELYFSNLVDNGRIDINNPGLLDSDSLELVVYTDRTGGIKSETISFMIEDKNSETEASPNVVFDLTRNEARYLLNLLQAFIDEDE